jgi:copper(I)-binding protein
MRTPCFIYSIGKKIMTIVYRFGGLLAALLMSASVYAGDIRVEDAWARATAPGQDAASVDMTITSKQAVTLVGVSSPVAVTAALHSMTTMDGMMTMREVEAIDIPAGKPMNLGESGYHLMLTGLKAPLKEGEMFPLALSIKMANGRVVKIQAMVEVKSLAATMPPSHDDGHMRMPM